jgi:hypothetical protein
VAPLLAASLLAGITTLADISTPMGASLLMLAIETAPALGGTSLELEVGGALAASAFELGACLAAASSRRSPFQMFEGSGLSSQSL